MPSVVSCTSRGGFDGPWPVFAPEVPGAAGISRAKRLLSRMKTAHFPSGERREFGGGAAGRPASAQV